MRASSKLDVEVKRVCFVDAFWLYESTGIGCRLTTPLLSHIPMPHALLMLAMDEHYPALAMPANDRA
eukprot:5606996-Pleurochrysis_carterae.AAC.1